MDFKMRDYNQQIIKFDYSPWPNVLTWVNLTTKRPAFYPPRGMKVNPKGEAPKGKL